MIRGISAKNITESVSNLCILADCDIAGDVEKCLKRVLKEESSSLAKDVMSQILKNIDIARKKRIPVCQDTGVALVFVELGQDARIRGGNLCEAINEGVRQGYEKGFLRKSIVRDPFSRENTRDNTPAVIHTDVVKGNKVKITVMPKGAGTENMSSLAMLLPSAGREEVKKFVVEKIKEAGANPCPPLLVGIGIGGTFDSVAVLAKKALLRPLSSSNASRFYAGMEKELLKEINHLRIGPQGFGGKFTALAVHINAAPCHIATLPVAVDINCHAIRHRSAVL